MFLLVPFLKRFIWNQPNHPAQKLFWVSAFLFFLAFSRAQAQFTIGEGIQFAVTVTASSAWSSVTVTSAVPSDFSYVSCGSVPCTDIGGVVYWYLGNIPAGQTVVVGYDAVVTSCAVNSGSAHATIIVGSPPSSTQITPVPYTVNCPTDTPTVTPTPTWTGTPTFTPTITPTPTVTLTPTITYTPTVTFTPTNTFTPTATLSPTDTPVPTATPVPLHVWPDPFNPRYAWNQELIAYQVPLGATMSIYTLSGELAAGPLGSDGTGHIYWKYALNNQGVKVSPGTYYYVIQSGNSTLLTGKLLVITGP